MAAKQALSAHDWYSYPSRQQPGHGSVNAVVQAFAAHPPIQFFVPKGTNTTGSATTHATTQASTVESRGRSVLVSGPHRSTKESKFASPPQRTSLPAPWASKVQAPGEQLSEQPPSACSPRVSRLASSEQGCLFIPPVGVSLSPDPCRRSPKSGVQSPPQGIGPQILGRVDSRSPDFFKIHDPQASQRTAENCHKPTQRPRSKDADNQLSFISGRYYTLSENLEQFKTTMERKVRACTQATMEKVADRKRMEQCLQVRWQTSLNEEVDARTAAVCRLDSEMTMLSANVNELREDVQRLMDLMYGELHSLLQSMQSSADSAPQSRPVVQQPHSQCSPVSPYAGRLVGASTAAASASPTLSTIAEDRTSSRSLTACASKEQTAVRDSTLESQEGAASLDQALVTYEELSNRPSNCNSSTEHRLQHAADILARASESAAALHGEQLAGMHDECRNVLKKLLDETIQGCVKYSIVKVAIFQALDALGTAETETLWRDTCWTLHKIEEWLAAKDRVATGTDEFSAKKILDATQANQAAAILLGSAEEWLTAKDRVATGKDELSAKNTLDATQADKAAAVLFGSADTAAGALGRHG